MDRPTERAERQQPVERFKPTTGAFVGWSGLTLAAGTIVYVLLNDLLMQRTKMTTGRYSGPDYFTLD